MRTRMVFVFEGGVEVPLNWQEDAITPDERKAVAYSIACGAVWRSEEDGLVLNLDKAILMRIEVEEGEQWEERVSFPLSEVKYRISEADESRRSMPPMSHDWAYFAGKVHALKALLGEEFEHDKFL